MEKNKLGLKIGAISLAIVSSCSAIFLSYRAYTKKEFQYKKSQTQILREVNDLNVNMDIINQDNKGRYTTVDIKVEKPLIISYDCKMDNEEVSIIKDVVDYCDGIFKTIDERYSLKLISSDSKGNEGVDIKIINHELKGATRGYNFSNKFITDNGNVIFKSYIGLDWKELSALTRIEAYYVVLHEFMHAFGFKDVYYKGKLKNYNYINTLTVLNNDTYEVPMIYPNDYAALQVLYSNEYSRNDYCIAIKIMEEKIKDYEEHFFSQYYKKIQMRHLLVNSDYKKEDLSFSWERVSEDNKKRYCNVEIRADSCQLNIKDEQGNYLESVKGEVISWEGVRFIPFIKLEDLSNYSGEEKIGAYIFFIVTKDTSGKIVLMDNLFRNKNKVNEMKR